MRRKNNILTTLLSALMVLTLTACLQINELERNPDGAITFRVVSKKSTKAEEITTNNLTGFDLRAYKTTDGSINESLFFTGTAEGNNGDGWTFDGTTPYWPQENLNFFALAPQGALNGTVDQTGMSIPDIVVDGQKDLIYAMNANEAKVNHIATPVALNFKHALSQIVFRVSNTNPRLNVIVKGIRIVGINDKGSLKISNITTDAISKGAASWENISASKAINEVSYEAFAGASGIWGVGELKGGELAGSTTWDKPAETSPLFLLPQLIPTWTVAQNPDETLSFSGSARIEVLCKIEQNWVTIWPRPSMPASQIINECAWLAIPLTNPSEVVNGSPEEVGWKSSNKYVYSLVFGEGAGYNPETNKPTIVPVRFKISVEDFTDGGTHDVP